jgi:hypothetical protein
MMRKTIAPLSGHPIRQSAERCCLASRATSVAEHPNHEIGYDLELRARDATNMVKDFAPGIVDRESRAFVGSS